jgi:hypothetical protein
MTGDGLIAAARVEALERRDRNDAERQRIERLIARHKATLTKIPYVGTRDVLEAVGRLAAERINASHGESLEPQVSGPFGMSPDWYLNLRSGSECWAIVKVVGGPERMSIRKEFERGPGTPFPDHMSDLVALFERQHAEDVAEKAAAASGTKED